MVPQRAGGHPHGGRSWRDVVDHHRVGADVGTCSHDHRAEDLGAGADAHVRQAGHNEGVEIRLYSIIYQALEDIQKALLGLLAPAYEDVLIGRVEVLQLFRVSRIGVIAGCRITDGRVERGAELRVIRNREEIWRGPLQMLRHFDQDVRSLDAPNECGISTTAFRGWEIGDQAEVWTRVEVERTLPLKQEVS